MEQIYVLAKKFGLPVAAQERATDYCRMFNVKCSNWSRQMSSQCLAVVCLDIASKTASLPFDKVIVLMSEQDELPLKTNMCVICVQILSL